METVKPARLPDGIPELPIVAGHLALDFANTVDDPLGPLRFDHLADYCALLVWSERMGLLAGASTDLLAQATQHPRRADSVVRRARALRDAINEVCGSVLRDEPPGDGWQALRPSVVAAIQHAELDQLTPSWDFTELESPLWPVALAAYELLTGPEVSRVKQCAGCPWLFLDQSKNGSRRWCSMEICGTNEKIRRYVSRRAERRTHS